MIIISFVKCREVYKTLRRCSTRLRLFNFWESSSCIPNLSSMLSFCPSIWGHSKLWNSFSESKVSTLKQISMWRVRRTLAPSLASLPPSKKTSFPTKHHKLVKPCILHRESLLTPWRENANPWWNPSSTSLWFKNARRKISSTSWEKS